LTTRVEEFNIVWWRRQNIAGCKEFRAAGVPGTDNVFQEARHPPPHCARKGASKNN
jgi:hypothetical protein